MTALAIASSNCKQQRERPTQTNSGLSDSNKNIVLGRSGCFTPRQTARLTVGRNKTLTLTPGLFSNLPKRRKRYDRVHGVTRRDGESGIVFDKCWESARFESVFDHRLSRKTFFAIFVSSCRKMPGVLPISADHSGRAV
jgi:hypothetical protein